MPHVMTLKALSPRQNGVAKPPVNANEKRTPEVRVLNVLRLKLLTPSERRVFDAVRAFNTNGVRPSYRDVAQASGYKSAGHVHTIIFNLEEYGYVTTGKFGERRAIFVTPAGWSA